MTGEAILVDALRTDVSEDSWCRAVVRSHLLVSEDRYEGDS